MPRLILAKFLSQKSGPLELFLSLKSCPFFLETIGNMKLKNIKCFFTFDETSIDSVSYIVEIEDAAIKMKFHSKIGINA